MSHATFWKAKKELEKDPNNKKLKENYEREHAAAVKANGCGGYCDNPYACPGGCYEY